MAAHKAHNPLKLQNPTTEYFPHLFRIFSVDSMRQSKTEIHNSHNHSRDANICGFSKASFSPVFSPILQIKICDNLYDTDMGYMPYQTQSKYRVLFVR